MEIALTIILTIIGTAVGFVIGVHLGRRAHGLVDRWEGLDAEIEFIKEILLGGM